MKERKLKKAFKSAFPLTIPIMAGYLCLGMGFGILLQSKGYGFFWCLFMSITIYSGSMQYVGVNLLAGGVSLVSTALITFMVNARYLFYGLSVLDKYKDIGKKKWLLIFELTDETYSIVCLKEPPNGVDKGWFYFFISFLNQIYWIIGCIIGNVLSQIVNFNSEGVDFAMTALFVVLFIEQWQSTKNHISAVIGIISSVLCLIIFGANNFIILTMILLVILLTIFRKKLESEEI